MKATSPLPLLPSEPQLEKVTAPGDHPPGANTTAFSIGISLPSALVLSMHELWLTFPSEMANCALANCTKVAAASPQQLLEDSTPPPIKVWSLPKPPLCGTAAGFGAGEFGRGEGVM